MKNIHLFFRCFRARPACAQSSLQDLTGPASCDVTMSHTCMDFRGARSGCHSNVTEIKAVIFLTFPFIFARFGRFGGFARFGRFGGFVSVVSLVSVVSFRPFRFVVSGFSTCRTSQV